MLMAPSDGEGNGDQGRDLPELGQHRRLGDAVAAAAEAGDHAVALAGGRRELGQDLAEAGFASGLASDSVVLVDLAFAEITAANATPTIHLAHFQPTKTTSPMRTQLGWMLTCRPSGFHTVTCSA
jgi:hypothetical protein